MIIETGGGPEPPSDSKDSKLNFKGQSIGIDQADVQGNGKSTILSWISLAVLEARPTDRHIIRSALCL